MKKKVLVIGSGAREAAIIRKLANDGDVKLFAAPGNAGVDALATRFPVKADDIPNLLELAQQNEIDLAVVGPEIPLRDGIVNQFLARSLRTFGPTSEAAQLETSKAWAKKFMEQHNIRTAPFKIFTDAAQAADYVKKHGAPLVVKADGLCGGKGVTVADAEENALRAIQKYMIEKEFGKEGEKVVIEEKLEGIECSFHAVTDGTNALALVSSADYKRRFDDDKGPNTGGMGAIAPHPQMTPHLYEIIMEKIVERTIWGMRSEGIRYRGVLYFGLMLTEDGPQVIEINTRFGDPETSVILPPLKSNLFDLLCAATYGGIAGMRTEWSNERFVNVVLVAHTYPEKGSKGKEITGIEVAERTGCLVFHAGTARDGSRLVTDGGRILNVVARGMGYPEAHTLAYIGMEYIKFEGMDYRRDIGRLAA